jgi:hypothetical protein
VDELSTDARTTTLGRRVRWLDRYRRTVAVVLAFGIAPLVVFEISELLGDEWPGFHAAMLAVLVSFMSWWVVEVVLAWFTAVWETEYDRLLRERGLPRARVISIRK